MRTRRGQSILEYTITVGIVVLVLSYMGTGMKRGLQSIVKVTADQIGNQANADQDFNDNAQGYMESSNTQTEQDTNNQKTEIGHGNAGYLRNEIFNESTSTSTNTITNGGFTPNN